MKPYLLLLIILTIANVFMSLQFKQYVSFLNNLLHYPVELGNISILYQYRDIYHDAKDRLRF